MTEQNRQTSERSNSGGELLVRITARCNARCDFCNATGTPPDFACDARAVRRRLRQVGSLGAVCLTGGEPTLVPRLARLVALAREEGACSVGLQSNGVLLDRPRALGALVRAGLSYVFLSIHSAQASVHDGMLGLPGAFAHLQRAARRCQDDGLMLGFNCVLTTRNIDGAAALVDHVARDFGTTSTYLYLSFVAPVGSALAHPTLIPPLARAVPAMIAALERGRARGLCVRVPGLCGVPLCALPGYEEQCDEFFESNPPRLSTRSFLPGCDACQHRAHCSGFWTAYLERFGSEGLGSRAPAPDAKVHS